LYGLSGFQIAARAEHRFGNARDALREKARRIDFFGFGASGIIALDAQQKFPLFGVPCLAHTDSHQQFTAAAMTQPGDVAVAIPNTGNTIAIIDRKGRPQKWGNRNRNFRKRQPGDAHGATIPGH